MNKYFVILLILFTNLSGGAYASAQIRVSLPKLPEITKPKPQTDAGRKGNVAENGDRDVRQDSSGRGKAAPAERLYTNQRPTGTPVLIRTSVYIQAKTHNQYWKAPNERNYSSWVPIIRFSQFYNNEKAISYLAEYFNPDGSAWYSETLEQGNLAADRTVLFQSPSPYSGVLDTKSSPATGLFSFKITDQSTKEVIFRGKFKVGKFATNGGPKEKKFDFFVDHDWLLPFGVIGFHHSDIEIGGVTPEVSVWLKGPVEAKELEGRVFYNGKQVASTTDAGGASGVSDYDQRTTEFAPPFAPQNIWKRWQFTWNNFRIDNRGGFNRDYYPNAHYADKNPGEYVVKIYRNGVQIRELNFKVGADGKWVVPEYSNQIFLPYHRVILPVKVIGNEKWDATAWKTDAFYGNLLDGFTAQ